MTEEEMEGEIWRDPVTRRLYDSILAYQGLIEKPWTTSDGTIVEGNRRIVCLRKICKDIKSHKVETTPELFNSVVCNVFPPDITQVEIDSLMGLWHVAGKREWSPFDQAKHIHGFYFDHDKTSQEISALIGVSEGVVKKAIWTYEEMLKFIKSRPREARIMHYSYFDELYKVRSGLYGKKFIKVDYTKRGYPYTTNPKEIGEFYDIIVQGKLGEAQGVRQLPSIVADPEAYEVLKHEGIQKALRVLESKERPYRPMEEIAMEEALNFERSEDRAPEDVSEKKMGYDIVSRGADQTRYIEVKGIWGPLESILKYPDSYEVSLTAGEWRKAHELEDEYWLYLVIGADKPKLYPVRNPASELTPSGYKFKIVDVISKVM